MAPLQSHTPLDDIRQLEAAVDRACAEMDRLRTQRDELLAALKVALAGYEETSRVLGAALERGGTLCNVSDLRAALRQFVPPLVAAIVKVEGAR